MRDSQKLVAERLGEIAKGLDLIFADDPSYSNTGWYRFYYGGMDLAGEIAYNFQADYCSFEMEGKDRPAVKYSQLGELLADIEEWLRAEA